MSKKTDGKSSQDYFSIIAMSKGFREFDKQCDFTTDEENMKLWLCRAQMAIAQQLSVISGHLSRIVQAAKELPSKPNHAEEYDDDKDQGE